MLILKRSALVTLSLTRYFFIVMLFCGTACFSPAPVTFPSAEQQALLQLKKANPAEFQAWAENWNEQLSPCFFRGVVCLQGSTHINEIHIYQAHLKNIPAGFFAAFPDIMVVELTQNDLASPIEISSLEKLITLDVSRNQIPKLQVWNLPTLENLYADENQLTALEIKAVPSLRKLSVAKNQLSSMPELDFPKLWTLDVSKNALTSFSVKKLPLLLQLSAYRNELTEIEGLFEHPQVRMVDISENKELTGVVPKKWCNQISIPVNHPVVCVFSEAKDDFCPPGYPPLPLLTKDGKVQRRSDGSEIWLPQGPMFQRELHATQTQVNASCVFPKTSKESP